MTMSAFESILTAATSEHKPGVLGVVALATERDGK
jgi:hypothetical protein